MPANAALEVGGEASRAGDRHLEPVAGRLVHLRPQRVDGHVDLRAGIHLHEDLGGRAVLRDDRRRHPVVDDALDVRERRRIVLDGGRVLVGEAAVACVDHDGRDDVGGAELGLQVLHPGGLGLGGQELRLLVLHDVAQRAEGGSAGAERAEPEQDEDGRDEDAKPGGHASRAGV